MAAIKMYVLFKDTPPVDDLCPHCFNPALKQFTLESLSWDGINILGTRVACTDCKVFTEPLKEIAA